MNVLKTPYISPDNPVGFDSSKFALALYLCTVISLIKLSQWKQYQGTLRFPIRALALSVWAQRQKSSPTL